MEMFSHSFYAEIRVVLSLLFIACHRLAVARYGVSIFCIGDWYFQPPFIPVSV